MDLKNKYDGKRLSTDEVAVARTEIDEATKALEQIKYETGGDYLLVKWGTWKEWNSENPKIQELLKEYASIGQSLSAMSQKNTPRQIELLCEIVDLIDGIIQNDWDGEYYSKQQAKEYFRGYGTEVDEVSHE